MNPDEPQTSGQCLNNKHWDLCVVCQEDTVEMLKFGLWHRGGRVQDLS